MARMLPMVVCLQLILFQLLLNVWSGVEDVGGQTFSAVKEVVVGLESLDEALESLPPENGLLRLVYNNSEAPTVMETLNVTNKVVTIQGQGIQGPVLTCSGGQPALRIIGGQVDVLDLAIDGCDSEAIHVLHSEEATSEWSLKVQRCRFTGNRHAIRKEPHVFRGPKGGNVNITQSDFISGGASAVELDEVDSLFILASNFVNNTSSEDVSGGGVLLHQHRLLQPWSLVVLQSVFKDNRGTSGGGMVVKGDVNGSVIVRESNFSNNFGVRGGGLVVFVLDNGSHPSLMLTVRIQNCIFTENSADTGSFYDNGGGGVHLSRITSAIVEKCVFEGCSSTDDGGGLTGRYSAFDGPWRLSVLDSVFNRNEAINRGGGIRVFATKRGTMTVKNSSFTGNRAHEGAGLAALGEKVGGFVKWPKIRVTIHKCRFLENYQPITRKDRFDGAGGGAYLQNIATTNLESSVFESCGAQAGGGLYWQHFQKSAVLNLKSSTFSRNSADNGGGAQMVGIGNLFMQECEFKENEIGGGGGGLFLVNAGESQNGARILDSRFVGNKASVGGAVYGESVGFLEISRSAFMRNRAVVGGAVTLQPGTSNEHEIDIHFSKFIGNTAEGELDSDGDLVDFAPFSGGGGAVAFISFCRTRNILSRSALWMVSTTFKGNTASNGGALLGFYPQRNRATWLEMEFCKFQGNTALESGGGIVVDDPNNVKDECIISSNCENWKGNTVKSGAGMADAPNAFAALELGSIELNVSRVDGPQSRPNFPPISLTIRDALNKTRAFGGIGEVEVTARILDENVVLFGTTRQFAVNGTVIFPEIRAWGPPGNYSILFNATASVFGVYTSRTVQNILTFELRDCEVGEWNLLESGEFLRCEHCNPKFFSLDPTAGSCEECVERCECDASEDNPIHPLVPQDGYWHSSPFSKQVHRCISEGSCTYDGRKKALQSFLAPHIPKFSTQYSQTEYPQCVEGSDGPLCGSCVEGYGHVKIGECIKCNSNLGPVLGIIASAIWTAALMWFTIYGNLPESKDSTQADENGCTNGIEVQDHQTEDMSCVGNGHGSIGISHDSVDEEEEESGKRSSQLFKIGVNFFQVNSTALMLKFGWMSFLITWMEFQDVSTQSTTSSYGDWLVPQCAFRFKQDRAVRVAHLNVAMPIALALVSAIGWAFFQMVRKKQATLRTEIAIILWSASFYAYNGLARSFMGMFNCIEVDTDVSEDPLNFQSAFKGLYWVGDTNFQCFHGRKRILSLITGFSGATLFLIGLPVFLTIFLYIRRDNLGNSEFLKKYGFLYKTYSIKCASWEAVIMLRKFAVNTIGVFGASLGIQLQGYLMLGVMAAALMVQLISKPFIDNKLNFMEAWSLFTTCSTFYLGGVMSERSTLWKGLLSGLALLMNVVFTIAMVMTLKKSIAEERILQKAMKHPRLLWLMSKFVVVQDAWASSLRRLKKWFYKKLRD